VALTATELNFDEFKSRGLHDKHGIVARNFISAFAQSWRKTKNLHVKVAGRRTFREHTLDFWPKVR
jgi:hypothetical protein